MKSKPAGWYRNLGDRRQHGYWDGDAWVDPPDLAPPSDTPDLRLDDELDADGGADAV
jgi:hypothetical protein